MEVTAIQRRGVPRAGAFLSALSLVVLPGPGAAQEGAVRLDLRMGAVYGGPLAEGDVLVPNEQGGDPGTVKVESRIGPNLDAALRYGISRAIEGELRIGVSAQRLEADGPLASWDSGDLTGVYVTGGLRLDLGRGLALRGGLGKLFYSSGAALLDGGASTGLLLSGGAGYRLPVTLPVGLGLEADAQWHGLGSPALRESGAADGETYRVLLGLAVTFGGMDETR